MRAIRGCFIAIGIAACAAAAAAAASVGAAASLQRPTFTSAVDLATFGVAVMDRQGQFISDLTAEDFVVLEDGRPQTLSLFTRGDGGEEIEMHLGLLFDTSA